MNKSDEYLKMVVSAFEYKWYDLQYATGYDETTCREICDYVLSIEQVRR